MNEPSPSPAPTGLRERNKQERRRRIKDAARAVFREKGFDLATTRDIADRADVANSTLFLYAQDKRELLLMIINDDLDPLSNKGLGPVDASRPVLEQFLDFLRPRYRYFAKNHYLCCELAREVFARSGTSGPEGLRFAARRAAMVDHFTQLVEARQALGLIDPKLEAHTVSRVCASLYYGALREWLSLEKPEPKAGLADLESLLRVALAGVDRA